jgi:hypothetical protein
MRALAELESAERGTGTGLCEWVCTQLINFRSRTGQPLPARIVYVGPERFAEGSQTDLIEQINSITDPRAQKRFVRADITEMAGSLSQLAVAAKTVIPGLRDMTPAEQGNLREYYKRLYRKA